MVDSQASLRTRGAEEADPSVRRRKRGDELRAAIHTAVLDELRENGFAALTMDAVAARARTGKATLYRYWPGKIELVVDAARSAMSRIDIPEDDADLRGQLLAVMGQIASDLGGPTGLAVRHLIAELVRTPELTETIGALMDDPAVPPILEVLRRAAVRGEVPAAALTPRVAAAGPDLLRSHAIVNGTPIPDSVVAEILDLVLLPLLRGYREPPHCPGVAAPRSPQQALRAGEATPSATLVTGVTACHDRIGPGRWSIGSGHRSRDGSRLRPLTSGDASDMAELEPRNFLQPCLLLLLRETPDHGYELAARLRPMHDVDGDAGGIYRALRSLEHQGLVHSEWHTSPTGPARRIYRVTEQGITALETSVAGLNHTHAALHVFLERYARLATTDGNGWRQGSAHGGHAGSRARVGGVRAAGDSNGRPGRGGS